MNLIKWEKAKPHCHNGYTEDDLINGDAPKYQIEYNAHLKINSSHHNTIYLASTEDAKQCAELIEKGRISE